ncbi:hypothetical protein CesoFtcFv8_000875 [Champsocephalus esox]|uniref:Uncharacterized protein n=1 Tax=Champsocephalus esox TaxID=159716 RepID=A0AAN8D3K7_9TELE|nr:hypothetical protein CesoFtcFv8_000875 [Champsocephalus esox]
MQCHVFLCILRAAKQSDAQSPGGCSTLKIAKWFHHHTDTGERLEKHRCLLTVVGLQISLFNISSLGSREVETAV